MSSIRTSSSDKAKEKMDNDSGHLSKNPYWTGNYELQTKTKAHNKNPVYRSTQQSDPIIT